MTVTLPPEQLERMLIERTRERDLARDLAVALEQEVAHLRESRDDLLRTTVGIILRDPWQDPTPRVLPERRDCACGGDIAGLLHGPDECINAAPRDAK